MSWPTVKLGDIAPSRPLKLAPIENNEEVWLLNLDMVESQSGRIINKVVGAVDEAGSSTHWFSSEHVLYSKLRPYLNKVVLPDSHGLATTELVPMLPDPTRLDRRYLAHYLRSEKFVNWVSEQVAGAKMPRVSMKIFWDHEIPLPPLAEQKRIAVILDKADAIRQKRKQAIDLADEFLRSVFLDMFGDPVTNPKGFPLGTIRDLVDTANYGTSGKASETDGEFPVLRMGNITYQGGWDFTDLKYIDLTEKELPKYLVHRGDLLFNRTNSRELVGKTAVYNQDEPMAFAGYLVRVRPNELGNNYYISGYLNSGHGKKVLVGMCKSIVGMANINAQELQDIKILLPPIEIQNQYESLAKSVYEKTMTHKSSSTELELLFNSLSQKAFSGEL
ncbi:restriction endonuclease subunit S [Vibrio crassostreae]|uniref:restriction endonuclease subunit S n=1 Tax=Vibrio crassostreae TaxID=246167 RepID=UPI0002D5B42C|nr:restriction endonuclease subunit S [Vibrio crassostreae]OED72171.1 restriction endonuclease [Vibrio crassostreae ZF-91]